MKACFVDTSGWAALVGTDERSHPAAVRFQRDWVRSGGVLVSTDYVLDETLTLLRARHGIDVAADWWDEIAASARVRWESVDSGRAARAREWFFKWRDHPFSLTDSASFVVMRELRLELALTTDHHFVVAGFEAPRGMLGERRAKSK